MARGRAQVRPRSLKESEFEIECEECREKFIAEMQIGEIVPGKCIQCRFGMRDQTLVASTGGFGEAFGAGAAKKRCASRSFKRSGPRPAWEED